MDEFTVFMHSRDWEKWFAWYPVFYANKWHWMKYVWRLRFPGFWSYRDLDEHQNLKHLFERDEYYGWDSYNG